jgi:hypothetical protein
LRFTASEEGDRAPQWSPDGRTIAFLSRRAGSEHVQVYVIPVSGGEAERMTAGRRRGAGAQLLDLDETVHPLEHLAGARADVDCVNRGALAHQGDEIDLRTGRRVAREEGWVM